MRVRYDRLGVMMNTWATLAASVVCFLILHHESMCNFGSLMMGFGVVVEIRLSGATGGTPPVCAK